MRPKDMPIGQILALGEDGHLMRTAEEEWEYAESASATAYSVDEREAKDILNSLPPGHQFTNRSPHANHHPL